MFLLLAAGVVLELYIPRWWVALLVLALAAVVAYFFARSFTRRIAQANAHVDKLLGPEPSDPRQDEDELAALDQSLRTAVPRIHDLVENLKLESARREAILASMVEGVLAVDRNLRVLFCNQSFARTAGAAFPVNPGTPLLELVRLPELREIMQTALESGQRVERRLAMPGAATRYFDILATSLEGASTRGALAIFHDISELERLERVRRDFVANVSHELRTPLTTIRGYAETLLDGALEDAGNNRRFVETIVAQATRLNNIAADLLTLSELEAGGTSLEAQPVSIRAVLESALDAMEAAARERGIRFVRDRMDEAALLGSELRLEQVFVNLLDNAVKFSRPNGEVRVEIQTTGATATVTISDRGIGIPSQDLPRIFERFYRVDKARSRQMGGTGLGLAIVKHVVEQMRGTITVDSRLGEGSTFTLALPVAATKSHESAQTGTL